MESATAASPDREMEGAVFYGGVWAVQQVDAPPGTAPHDSKQIPSQRALRGLGINAGRVLLLPLHGRCLPLLNGRS